MMLLVRLPRPQPVQQLPLDHKWYRRIDIMKPEEKRENNDMQNLNPQITEVTIGIRSLRKIKLYPLSVGDQMKMTALMASTISGFLVTKEAKDETAMVGFFVQIINENLARFVALAIGEKEDGEGKFPETDKMLEDTTNVQASEIAKVIYEVNYETSVKNFQSLFEQMKKLFPLERSLPESVKDTITDLETSLGEPSKKEDLQEDN